jgi:hypothetical protein
MGNLSEHFNQKNFICRCGKCGEKFKISLTLVGILENIFTHFNRPVKIIEAYRCPDNPRIFESTKIDPHTHGKAADITIEGVPLNELFNFIQKIPEVSGLGFNPEQNFIHLEVGQPDREIWLGEGSNRQNLSGFQQEKYQLQVEPAPSREKKLAVDKLAENDF